MKMRKNSKNSIPTLKFNSDWFECPNPKCGYKEMRRVLGDISHSPCPKCGNPTMRRMK